ncbi:MAG: zinc-binding alcohol dehydrogenase [Planctomycetota bacterium]
MKTIHQIAVIAPETIECIKRPLDESPLKPDEIAGRTLATVVSAGTELAYFYQSRERTYPCFPGYAAVFEIDQTGSDVADLRIGDRVFCMGGHASRQRCKRIDAVRIPDGLKPEAAACARLAGISMTTLVTTPVRPPETVLITGLGPVGNFAAQAFRNGGYRVIGIDPSPVRRQTAADCGLTDIRESVPDETDPIAGTVGLIAECSGHEQATLDALRVIRKRGEIVLIGVPWRKRTEATAFDILNKVFHQYAVIRSGWEWELPLRAAPFQPASIFGNIQGALDWIADGRIITKGLLESRSPLDAPAVYRALNSGATDRLIQAFDWTDPKLNE